MAGTVVRIGCCGYNVSKSKYYQTFDVVEIQQTFYQLPRPETAEKWRSEAPEGFEFTMKAWQLITHEPSSPTYRRLRQPVDEARKDRYGAFRPTEEVWQAWQQTAEFAESLGATVIVFQCPASFRPTTENIANLEEFFRNVDRGPFRFVWEPRGGWPADLVRQLCDELGLVHCVDPLKDNAVGGDFVYYRLHGRTGYRYVHTDEDFHEIYGKLRSGVRNYVMFNNVQMFDDALRFVEFLRQRQVP